MEVPKGGGKRGVRPGTPITELGRLMRTDHAKAALLLVEAFEKTGWNYDRAGRLLGFTCGRSLGNSDGYAERLGLREIVRENHRNDWASTGRKTGRRPKGKPIPLIVRYRQEGKFGLVRSTILESFRATGGNGEHAAKRLGMAYGPLRVWVSRLGLWDEINAIRLGPDGNARSRGRWLAWKRSKGGEGI